MNSSRTSIVEILQWRAKKHPDDLIYRFLKDGEENEELITYQELDLAARSIGAMLQDNTNPGERTLLLLPSGLDFISSFLACLYAKVLAVPLPAPHPARIAKTLKATFRVIEDVKPSTAILSSSLLKAINDNQEIKDKFEGIKLMGIDNINLNKLATPPDIDSNEIAFIQYTSGSTSKPKGVMVSHGNLIHNLEIIKKSCEVSRQSQGVIWLPPYHDMGLITGILQPLYSGFCMTLMPHLYFLQRPIRWLKAISKYKATASGGPNFAYELCLKRIKPEERSQLDLSHWEVAFNGAEQINSKTLDRFSDYFSTCGFNKKAFFPCYGLAEATIFVTGGPKRNPPVYIHVFKSELENNRVRKSSKNNSDTRTLVSSGQIFGGQSIKIVNPNSFQACRAHEIGEIWISGPSVTKGYWKNKTSTESTFHAQIEGNEEQHFLRTGDLGFIDNNELFITGRQKNLIIINGKNLYPHDIELTVEASHNAIKPSGSAVFSIEHSGMERVVVYAEINHKAFIHQSEIESAVRKAVSEDHGIFIHDIKLGLPGSIPRTTSGKRQHFLCKKKYLSEINK